MAPDKDELSDVNAEEGLDNNQLARIRTMLANVRTFLAWCRTSLAIICFGFVFEKFVWYLKREAGIDVPFSLHRLGILSYVAFALGLFIFVASAARYIQIGRQLKSRDIGFKSLPELALTTTIVVLVVLLILSSREIIP